MNDTDVHNFAVQAGRPSGWPFTTIARNTACVIIGEVVHLIATYRKGLESVSPDGICVIPAGQGARQAAPDSVVPGQCTGH